MYRDKHKITPTSFGSDSESTKKLGIMSGQDFSQFEAAISGVLDVSDNTLVPRETNVDHDGSFMYDTTTRNDMLHQKSASAQSSAQSNDRDERLSGKNTIKPSIE